MLKFKKGVTTFSKSASVCEKWPQRVSPDDYEAT
jgi:hypothetical protein